MLLHAVFSLRKRPFPSTGRKTKRWASAETSGEPDHAKNGRRKRVGGNAQAHARELCEHIPALHPPKLKWKHSYQSRAGSAGSVGRDSVPSSSGKSRILSPDASRPDCKVPAGRPLVKNGRICTQPQPYARLNPDASCRSGDAVVLVARRRKTSPLELHLQPDADQDYGACSAWRPQNRLCLSGLTN